MRELIQITSLVLMLLLAQQNCTKFIGYDSGATVRTSRESASYQRALVEAGIITDKEVIISNHLII